MKSQKITIKNDFSKYTELFLEINSRLNLISKNETKFLYEKHIYDSLAFQLFYNKYKCGNELLDLGTGGGFPAIPIAIEYPDIQVTGLDSIRKKINAVTEIKESLNLNNLNFICDRAENIKEKKFDIITSRAVARLDVLAKYASPLLKKNGYFVIYKSKTANEELEEAKDVLKRTNLKYIECIDYTLPLDEVYERKLVILQKIL